MPNQSLRANLLALALASALAIPLSVGCSGTSTTGSTPSTTTVGCRQATTSDTNGDCDDHAGKPRSLFCDSDSQVQEALTAGCVREKATSDDVCCPTTVTGKPDEAPSTTTVACRQGKEADTSGDCKDHPGKSRSLYCDTTGQVEEALAAGCVREKATSDDVCCPTTVSGKPDPG